MFIESEGDVTETDSGNCRGDSGGRVCSFIAVAQRFARALSRLSTIQWLFTYSWPRQYFRSKACHRGSLVCKWALYCVSLANVAPKRWATVRFSFKVKRIRVFKEYKEYKE